MDVQAITGVSASNGLSATSDVSNQLASLQEKRTQLAVQLQQAQESDEDEATKQAQISVLQTQIQMIDVRIRTLTALQSQQETAAAQSGQTTSGDTSGTNQGSLINTQA